MNTKAAAAVLHFAITALFNLQLHTHASAHCWLHAEKRSFEIGRQEIKIKNGSEKIFETSIFNIGNRLCQMCNIQRNPSFLVNNQIITPEDFSKAFQVQQSKQK